MRERHQSSWDSLSTIATGLANAIASDSTLSSLGITASAASTVVNLKSTSNNLTTYASSVSTGATETIKLGNSLGVTSASFNNLNELTATSAGGNAHFQGDTNKPIVSAAINSIAAALPTSTTFNANAPLSTGSNSVSVNAVDGGSNSVSNGYQLSVPSGSATSLTFDANGNMTSDGTNSFSYDAENRLIKITYPGSGNYSAFTFDGLDQRVQIAEYSGGTLSSTKQFVWSGGTKPKEARNASGTITAQYFGRGEIISGTDYFFTKDKLGSIREMTNSSGAIVDQLAYDPYGRATTLQGGGTAPDFQFAGYYFHAPSGLLLTATRSYSANLGRFINRDTIGGSNLYAYAGNAPNELTDPSGRIALIDDAAEVYGAAILLTALMAAINNAIQQTGSTYGSTPISIPTPIIPPITFPLSGAPAGDGGQSIPWVYVPPYIFWPWPGGKPAAPGGHCKNSPMYGPPNPPQEGEPGGPGNSPYGPPSPPAAGTPGGPAGVPPPPEATGPFQDIRPNGGSGPGGGVGVPETSTPEMIYNSLDPNAYIRYLNSLLNPNG